MYLRIQQHIAAADSAVKATFQEQTIGFLDGKHLGLVAYCGQQRHG
jgi:hypothetical protein